MADQQEQTFVRQHFDKLLLAGLFLFAFIAFLVFSRSAEFYSTTINAEHLSDVIHWLEGIVGQILAALLTMMVGRSIAASAHVEPSGRADVQAGDSTATVREEKKHQ